MIFCVLMCAYDGMLVIPSSSSSFFFLFFLLFLFFLMLSSFLFTITMYAYTHELSLLSLGVRYISMYIYLIRAFLVALRTGSLNSFHFIRFALFALRLLYYNMLTVRSVKRIGSLLGQLNWTTLLYS
jgi:hypothetical protein